QTCRRTTGHHSFQTEEGAGQRDRVSLASSSSGRYGSIAGGLAKSTTPLVGDAALSTRRSYLAVAVLCYLNLLNFMDRYTIAGVLLNIQKFFDINDSTSGLLQTVFIFSFILLAPLFGYLGDRYNRKWIMIGGLSVWLVMTLCGSFVNKKYFWVLVLMRALVGTGEASYSTIAPTIIGDMFSGGRRTIAISLFYVVLPVGSGLGYIMGSTIATATGDWRWALRVCPVLGAVGVVLLVFLCPNPPRGASETRGQGVAGRSSYLEDIKYLLKNKSFVWSSLGITSMSFVTGALAFWAPTFLSRAQVAQGSRQPCVAEPCDTSDSFIFGAVTVASGIFGVGLGTLLTRGLIGRVPHVDPLICAVGMLGCIPCLLAAIFLAARSIPVTYVFVFLGETLLSLNWPIMGDIVLVSRGAWRSTRLKGGSSPLLGHMTSPPCPQISDSLSAYDPGSPQWRFHSLQYSFLLCPAVAVLGGVFYLVNALYITRDKMAAQRFSEGEQPTVLPKLGSP
uniref:SPNS lysolipid transporter 3, sphingosine-1-phosphate (putative) n=1 Tax=Gadus morhua TaxID=8049 RepID=A0A8C4ZZ97_GADMO